jgi:hypothetical protein
MRDVNYFIIEASKSKQREFELNFADVIEVFGINSVELTTEDKKKLIITWDPRGHFKSYFVDVVHITAQMKQGKYIEDAVNDVIEALRSLTYKGDSVDGETMQYILEKVGMDYQMLRQLMLSLPINDVEYNWEERRSL